MEEQSRRILVLEQEREGLRLMLDQEYVRIGADLEVEAVREAGYAYGAGEGAVGGMYVGGMYVVGGDEGDGDRGVVVEANEEGAVVGFGGEVVHPVLVGGGGGELLGEEEEAEEVGYVTCVEIE
jgi:hypothetical protein